MGDRQLKMCILAAFWLPVVIVVAVMLWQIHHDAGRPFL